jgi:hypothetical protein
MVSPVPSNAKKARLWARRAVVVGIAMGTIAGAWNFATQAYDAIFGLGARRLEHARLEHEAAEAERKFRESRVALYRAGTARRALVAQYPELGLVSSESTPDLPALAEAAEAVRVARESSDRLESAATEAQKRVDRHRVDPDWRRIARDTGVVALIAAALGASSSLAIASWFLFARRT